MLKGLIKRLEKEGKLKEQKVGFLQIEALLREAIIDIINLHGDVKSWKGSALS